MCDDRKLERVGVVRHVVGIHCGWDSTDHFGNPTVYHRDLPFGFAQRRDGRDQHKLNGRVVATRPAHRTSCEVYSNLVKKKRLLLEHIPGLQNPSDGLTKSFKTRDMLINLEKEVGLVPGLDTNGLSWIRTFQRRLQLLAEEGEMSSLLEGSVAPEF